MKRKAFTLGISLIFSISWAKECNYHKVKSGETLEKIAKNYGVSVQEILKANKTLKPEKLKIGEKICIPFAHTKSLGIRDYAIYKVKKGDTLEGIANKFEVSLEELKNFNNLKTTKLTEGQEIKIPAKAVVKKTGKQVKEYQTYVIQKGGKLEHIAKKLGVSEKELVRLNPELKGKWLEKGTVVKIPSVSNRNEEKDTEYDIYTVKKGGKLEHVAKNLGISLKELEKLNPDLKNKWLSEGTKVKIPTTAKNEETGNYRTYVVQKNSKLEHVARKLGISEKELEKLNPNLRNKWLKKGTIVKIPTKYSTQTTQATKEERQLRVAIPQEKEDASLNKQATNPTEVKISKDSLPMPVEGEVTKNNRGVNISAQCGTPVKVVEEGKVIYSGGDLQAYGNMVIVDHGDFISLYAHNQTNLVKRGEYVSKNQEIALVGKKSNSENCILYFELRNKEGIPIDPTEYFKNAQ